MGVVLMEGFKYLDALSVGRGYYGSASAPVWNREAGRGSRYGISHTTDGDYFGYLILPLYLNGSYGFAANHTNGTGANLDYVGLAWPVSSDPGTGSTRSGVSIGPGTAVGTDSGYYSGSSAWVFPDTTPTTVGWHWWNVIHTNVNTSSGSIQVYRDGVLVAEQSPDVAGTSLYNALVIRIGQTGHSLGYLIVSDLIIRDDTTPIPDSRVDVIDLASTTSAQWTGSDADQVDNHLLLNGTGPTVDQATYVEADSAGLADAYTLSALPASGIGTIHAVQTTLFGATDDAGHATAASVNGTQGTVFSPLAGAAASDVWETNPSGGGAWDKASVEAATIGLST